MQNVHPIFQRVLAPIAPRHIPELIHFKVEIRIGKRSEEVNVAAFTTVDAITRAFDIYFDGDEQMPTEGVVVVANPINKIRAAA